MSYGGERLDQVELIHCDELQNLGAGLAGEAADLMDFVAGVAVTPFSGVTVWYCPVMKWLQWNPDRNRTIAAVFTAICIVAFFVVFLIYFPDFQQRIANARFGPDWECTPQPRGGPICIKKLGK